jgi:osmotically-inducible protein OsmY
MREIRSVAADDHLPEVREPAGYRRAEVEIATELRERLADDVGLDERGIEIEVKGCEVTIRGGVRHCGDAKRAEAHACAVAGVTVVRNELQAQEPPAGVGLEDPSGSAVKMGKPRYER